MLSVIPYSIQRYRSGKILQLDASTNPEDLKAELFAAAMGGQNANNNWLDISNPTVVGGKSKQRAQVGKIWCGPNIDRDSAMFNWTFTRDLFGGFILGAIEDLIAAYETKEYSQQFLHDHSIFPYYDDDGNAQGADIKSLPFEAYNWRLVYENALFDQRYTHCWYNGRQWKRGWFLHKLDRIKPNDLAFTAKYGLE